jgi:hypothetical protein
MKRITMMLHGSDKYGHWWTEIHGKKSYGWWPKKAVTKQSTVEGVEGELNGVTNFGGKVSKDPHHGDTSDIEFNPVLTEDMTASELELKIDNFAKTYNGSWGWFFGYGQNCHSFQVEMMKQAKLKDPRSITQQATDTCVIQ